MPLNSAWTSRRNGSSNRKKLMSLPNTGSTTADAGSGENGTRFTQSRTVSQTLASEPPIVRATRAASPTRATPAIGVMSGKSPESKTVGRAFCS
jgi:hypothetical protein